MGFTELFTKMLISLYSKHWDIAARECNTTEDVYEVLIYIKLNLQIRSTKFILK